MSLGQGYDLIADAPTPIACVEGPLFTRVPPGFDGEGVPIYSFYVDRPQEIRSKAIEAFSYESDYSVFDPSGSINTGVYDNGLGRNGLTEFVASFFGGPEGLNPSLQKNDQLLVVAMHLPTVTNRLVPHTCGQSVPRGDYAATMEQCGDGYLHSEAYGGLVFLALPRPELQDPQIMADVDKLLRVDSVNHNLRARGTLKELQDLLDGYGLNQLEFSVLMPNTWMNLPAVQAIVQNGQSWKVRPIEGRDVLQELIDFTQVAMANANANSNGYIANPPAAGLGHKLRRLVRSYENLSSDVDFLANSGTENWFNSCDIPRPDDYQCYLDFASKVDHIQAANRKGSFHRTAEYARDALSRTSDFAWPIYANISPPTPVYSFYQGFVDYYDDCMGTWGNQPFFVDPLVQCRGQMLNSPEEDLCSVCTESNFPVMHFCSAANLQIKANALPEIFEKAAFTPPTTDPLFMKSTGAPVQLQSSDDYVCTLSSLSGDMTNTSGSHFFTSSPGAGLTFDNASPPNFMVQKTAYYPNSVAVGSTCIAKVNFYGTNFPGSEPWISQDPAFVTEVLNVASDDDLVTNDPAAAGALLGVTGNFRGSGESVRAMLNDPNKNFAELHSLVSQAGSHGRLKSHVTQFGLMTAIDGVAQHYLLNNRKYQVHINTFDGDAGYVTDSGDGFLSPLLNPLSVGRTKDYVLAPVDEAYCHLTQVAGEFAGGGEKVEITTRGTNWILSVKGATGKVVQGEARCYLYNQQDFAP